MSRWSAPLGQRVGLARLATLLIGMLAAVPVGHAEPVFLKQLDFLDKLKNPCQIVLIGDLLPLSNREERQDDAQLVVELRRARRLAHFVRDDSGATECNGLHLEGQPLMDEIDGLQRRQAMMEMYRVFLYETAHLYLMAQEIRESHHTCGNESRRLVDELVSLAGLLQNILCVISENVEVTERTLVRDKVFDLKISKFRDCTQRLMRNCLVLDHTIDILSKSLSYMLEPQTNFLQPRLIVG